MEFSIDFSGFSTSKMKEKISKDVDDVGSSDDFGGEKVREKIRSTG